MYEFVLAVLIGIAFKEWVKGHPGEVSMLFRRMALVCKVQQRRFSKLSTKERDENKQLRDEVLSDCTDVAVKLIGEAREHLLMEIKSDRLGQTAEQARSYFKVCAAPECEEEISKFATVTKCTPHRLADDVRAVDIVDDTAPQVESVVTAIKKEANNGQE